MNSCCKKLLENIQALQKFRLDTLTIRLENIEQKENKTTNERGDEVVLMCWRAEAERFLELLKEIKL